MSRKWSEQEAVRARQLQALGVSYAEIAAALGCSKGTAAGLVRRPERLPRTCVCGQQFHDKDVRARYCSENCYKRAYERDLTKRRPCSECGQPMGSASKRGGSRCRDCRQLADAARVGVRRERVVKLWGDGMRTPQIARLVGLTACSLRSELARMRKAGYELELRRPDNLDPERLRRLYEGRDAGRRA